MLDLFLDDNDINEKSIIGFISFTLMTIFGICDLVTAFMGQDLVISDTIYTSFVVVTLGVEYQYQAFRKINTEELSKQNLEPNLHKD